MWNSLDACSRRPSLLVVRTLTEAPTVLTWKVQVCMRCRYASELGLHVEVGPLIIATLVSPCALAALSHPSAYIISPRQSTMYTFPSAGSFQFRRVSAKYPRETHPWKCVGTRLCLVELLTKTRTLHAFLFFFFFFFLILATFPSLLSRTSFVDARLRLQDPLIFQFFSSGMWNTSSIWISRIN